MDFPFIRLKNRRAPFAFSPNTSHRGEGFLRLRCRRLRFPIHRGCLLPCSPSHPCSAPQQKWQNAPSIPRSWRRATSGVASRATPMRGRGAAQRPLVVGPLKRENAPVSVIHHTRRKEIILKMECQKSSKLDVWPSG